MLVAAAICPNPPVLVPELAQGAASELDDLRTACDEAVAGLVAAAPERITVVASGTAAREWAADGLPDFTAYGLSDGDPSRPAAGTIVVRAPLGLTVGAWLLDRNDVTVPRTYVETTGSRVPVGDEPTALLVLADGSAMRAPGAPGSLDERAEAFDADIAKAVATGDGEALERLDRSLGDDLWARGVPALHALGATVRAHAEAAPAARLLYDAAPYGVGYVTGLWRWSE